MKKSAASNKNMRILDGIPMLIVAVVIVIALIALGFVGTNNLRRTLIRIFLYCAMASMWNLMSGYTGMTSLGQQTFIGVAGYTMAVFTAKLMLPFGVGLLAGGVIGGILALILSVILFRMRGMYFAIATWVIAEALKTFFKSWEFVNMGGGMTVKSSIRPNSTGIYLMALVLMVIAIILIYILLRSKLGLGLTAMRDDADAASSVGVNIFQSKLLCFVICGIFCALAGGIYYLNYVSIYPNSGFHRHHRRYRYHVRPHRRYDHLHHSGRAVEEAAHRLAQHRARRHRHRCHCVPAGRHHGHPPEEAAL